MTAQILSQIVLPLVLALIMLAMGLNLKLSHFTALLGHPGSALLGIVLQLFALPAIAWLVIIIFQLPPLIAAGLLLLAVAPGGATSNLFSFLCQGNLALSIALTAIVSLISPMTIALFTQINFSWLGLHSEEFNLPLLPTLIQLTVVTISPVLLGMSCQARLPNLANKFQPWLVKISSSLMIILVAFLTWINWQQLPNLLSQASVAVMVLIISAMAAGYCIGKLFRRDEADCRTLLMEVGIQNAGTAMMVAFSLLHNPALAMIPLLYGIVMNVPAIMAIAHFKFWPDKSSVKSAAS